MRAKEYEERYSFRCQICKQKVMPLTGDKDGQPIAAKHGSGNEEVCSGAGKPVIFKCDQCEDEYIPKDALEVYMCKKCGEIQGEVEIEDEEDKC